MYQRAKNRQAYGEDEEEDDEAGTVSDRVDDKLGLLAVLPAEPELELVALVEASEEAGDTGLVVPGSEPEDVGVESDDMEAESDGKGAESENVGLAEAVNGGLPAGLVTTKGAEGSCLLMGPPRCRRR